MFTHADPETMWAERKNSISALCTHANSTTTQVTPKPPVEMIPIWEGDGLDIGTFSFEVILIPGHTPGSIALLEPDKKFLIGGDSIQTGGSIFMSGPGRNFESFRASMAKLEEYIDEFDVVYSSHNDLKVEPRNDQ